jgi:hypothetical protein
MHFLPRSLALRALCALNLSIDVTCFISIALMRHLLLLVAFTNASCTKTRSSLALRALCALNISASHASSPSLSCAISFSWSPSIMLPPLTSFCHDRSPCSLCSQSLCSSQHAPSPQGMVSRSLCSLYLTCVFSPHSRFSTFSLSPTLCMIQSFCSIQFSSFSLNS